MKGNFFAKTVVSFVAVSFVLYVGVYLALSYNGRYKTSNVLKGKVEWYPAGCKLLRVKPWGEEEKWEADFGGYLFFPLIYVDRGLWHKDKPLSKHMLDETKEALGTEDE